MTLLVFGPITGYSSYPVVMRGLSTAFDELGIKDIVIANISGPGDLTQREVKGLSVGIVPEDFHGSTIFAMKPTLQMIDGWKSAGCKVVGMFVGDVSEIPDEWAIAMRLLDLLVVPSKYMVGVVKKDGIKTRAIVSNHGIESDYFLSPTLDAPPPGRFSFLHFCSATTFPQRKGTPEALEAFQKVCIRRKGVAFTLVIPEYTRKFKKLLGKLPMGVRERVIVSTRPFGLTPGEIIEFYKKHHVLLCPSRAEGFGIMPLEARALGVPVIQTINTGMLDHFGAGVDDALLKKAGVIRVPSDEVGPAWGDFGEAPIVKSEAIYNAMVEAISHYPKLKKNAINVAEDMSSWSWVETTRDLAKSIEGL